VGKEALAAFVTENHDLERVAREWPVSASRRYRDRFAERLERLTVLDPTCGTGPFLLAAMRVLETLYAALHGEGYPRANMRRRIIERTLHGVDLHPEAVEVCRLRLRLELLAAGETVPTDMSDNLRVGNALVGSPSPFARGQYDIVLGNPPYLELREVDYQPRGFRCQESRAVHALCVERGLQLLRPDGWMSMIVPMSLVSTQRMKCVQELLEEGRHVWYANFSWRPGRLFANVHRAVTLFIATASECPRTWTTGYQKWRTRERSRLMSRVRYVEAPRGRLSFWVPKLSDQRERRLLDRLLSIPTVVADYLAGEDSPERRVYYRTDGGLYWKVFTDFAPSFSLDGQAGHSTRETWLTLHDASHVKPLVAALSSDLYWWWYTVTSNGRHLNPIDLHRFPLPASALSDSKLARLGHDYLRDIVRHSAPHTRRQQQTGHTETQTFRIHRSRPLILAIGKALAPHYGLTDDERDYLANYDLAFRMSRVR
jgi:hypothetical protein